MTTINPPEFIKAELLNIEKLNGKYFLKVIHGDSEGNIISPEHPTPIQDIKYNTNDIEEASSTVTYIGMEDKNGNWSIKQINTITGAVFSYATVLNNVSYTTYDSAWTARASLTYENYGDAF